MCSSSCLWTWEQHETKLLRSGVGSRIPTSGYGVGSVLRKKVGESRFREGVGGARFHLPQGEGRKFGGARL